LDASGSGDGRVLDYCEHDNKPSGCMLTEWNKTCLKCRVLICTSGGLLLQNLKVFVYTEVFTTHNSHTSISFNLYNVEF
jgi:hypothetical protein